MNYITTIKDVIGNNYLAIGIQEDKISKYLLDLKTILNEEYDEYISNKNLRDNDKYHITIFNVAEFNKLLKENFTDFTKSIGQLFTKEIDDLRMLGVGVSQRNENKAYYIVCKSKKVDDIREECGLTKKDLHITIGFKNKDVFGGPKDTIIILEEIPIQKIREYYQKNENWDFVKTIENYDFDESEELIPIRILDNTVEFKVGDFIIGVSYFEDFRIVYQFINKEKQNRLPKSIISKKLNKK